MTYKSTIFDVAVTKDMTYYAKWISLYTVNFDSKGGSAVSPQTIAFNDKVIAPTPPIREGHVFGGWYSDAGFTDAFNFETPVTTAMTLYAKWTQQFTVNIDYKNGSAIESQKVFKDETISAPVEPVREGYAFKGWYTDEGMTNAYDFATPVTENLTLYANWKILRTVTFYDMSVPPESRFEDIKVVVVDGDTVTPPNNILPKIINGNKAGVRKWKYENGMTDFNFDTPITSSIKIQANWLPLYTVKFETDGGTLIVDQEDIWHNDQVMEPTPPVKADYVFDGWFTLNSYDNKLYSYAFYSKVTKNLTLYAQWSPVDNINVMDDTNSLTDSEMMEEDDAVSLPSTSVIESYISTDRYAYEKRMTPSDFLTQVMSKNKVYEPWYTK